MASTFAVRGLAVSTLGGSLRSSALIRPRVAGGTITTLQSGLDVATPGPFGRTSFSSSSSQQDMVSITPARRLKLKDRDRELYLAEKNRLKNEYLSEKKLWAPLPKHGHLVRAGENQVSVVSHVFPEEMEHPLGPVDDTTSADKRLFAVVTVAGTQFKVSPGDKIIVNKVDGQAGDNYIFDHVLLVGTPTKTLVGRPVVPSAKVTALIEEQTKDSKVIILKKRRKNNRSKRMKGFRRKVSFLRITDIDCDDI